MKKVTNTKNAIQASKIHTHFRGCVNVGAVGAIAPKAFEEKPTNT